MSDEIVIQFGEEVQYRRQVIRIRTNEGKQKRFVCLKEYSHCVLMFMVDHACFSHMDSDVCRNARMSSLPSYHTRIFNVAELNVLEGSGEMKVFFDNTFSHTLCECILKFSGPGKCFIHYNSAMLCDPDDSWHIVVFTHFSSSLVCCGRESMARTICFQPSGKC